MASSTVLTARTGGILNGLREWPDAWALTVLLAFLVLYPLGMLFVAGFQGPQGGATLDNYLRLFSQAQTWHQIWTTLWLGAVRASLATIIGVFLAWVVTRTDTPGRGAISFFIWMGYFAPTLPILVSWVLIAGQTGVLNAALAQFHLPPFFDVYSYAGIIWVSSLNLGALVFILVEPAFRAMDSSLEESARLCGASRLTALARITIPALSPAILGALLYSFLLAVESFEPELVFGTPARIYVLSTRIYSLTQDFPQDMPGAAALSSFVLTLVTLLLILQNRALAGRSFVTVTGRTGARLLTLGRWRWLTFGLSVFYFLCATVLPVGMLALGSFMRGWGMWRLSNFTTDNWNFFFADDRLLSAIWNTLLLGLTVGIAGTLLCAATSYLILRSKFPGRPLLSLISWAPRTMPAVVAGVAYGWAYVSGTPLLVPLLGTIWILAIVLAANTMPVGTRTISGALSQIGASLEHAARIAGAGWATTMRRILLPLLAPALMNAFVLLFLLAVRNLALVLFFYTPSSRVLSTVLWEAWSGNAPEQGLVAGMVMMLISCAALVAAFLLRRAGEK